MRALERALVRYLRWRGWVVFWLDPQARHCGQTVTGELPRGCWLRLYVDIVARDRGAIA